MKILRAEAVGLELDKENIVITINIAVPEQELNIIKAQKYARLIAAAPMMLDALTALYSWVRAEAEHFDANTPDDDMIEAVEAAIEAAKGE